jgi:hypothetical protein
MKSVIFVVIGLVVGGFYGFVFGGSIAGKQRERITLNQIAKDCGRTGRAELEYRVIKCRLYHPGWEDGHGS